MHPCFSAILPSPGAISPSVAVFWLMPVSTVAGPGGRPVPPSVADALHAAATALPLSTTDILTLEEERRAASPPVAKTTADLLGEFGGGGPSAEDTGEDGSSLSLPPTPAPGLALRVVGECHVGATLTAAGTVPGEARCRFRWFRVSGDGESQKEEKIDDAKTPRYRLTSDDIGHRLRVVAILAATADSESTAAWSMSEVILGSPPPPAARAAPIASHGPLSLSLFGGQESSPATAASTDTDGEEDHDLMNVERPSTGSPEGGVSFSGRPGTDLPVRASATAGMEGRGEGLEGPGGWVPEEQRGRYLEAWKALLEVCAGYLEDGACMIVAAHEAGILQELLACKEGRAQVKALGLVYFAAMAVLSTVAQVEETWGYTGIASADHSLECIRSFGARCRTAWEGRRADASMVEGTPSSLQAVTTQLGKAQRDAAVKEAPEVTELLALLQQAPATTPHKSSKEGVCQLTLLPLERLQEHAGVERWLGKMYLRPVANLWANSISRDPPVLPMLIL
ncbi:hypothetical protein CYMTET_54812 [Cymbomonas tetramitiformis]|uniref:Uncharacterized protein n=1 Tax=Cymbomonas tetramitiformis TaxID=36881 RepID=A0AAE0BEH3_9CHLO|nr:hypothetical protein CYMTET_54812 [Cymbomonas tetramitiformis]